MADDARASDVNEGHRYTSDYLRRLLVERNHIMAALLNPGGSVILTGTAATTERVLTYSSQIDNDFHLDLIEAAEVFYELPKGQRDALLAWADGLSAQQAADWLTVRPSSIRSRRSRALSKLAEEMSLDGSQEQSAKS